MSLHDVIYDSPNFGYPKGSFGRGGHNIAGICLHVTGARWESNYNWMMNPAANASYNAVVRQDGSVISLVPEQNAAYSHGRINKATWPLLKEGVNPNLYTLSLARTGSDQRTWTPEQLAATLKVLKAWGEKYDLPMKRPYVFGHFEIDSVNRWYCPGDAFFERVVAELAKLEPDEDPVRPVAWHRVVAGSFRNESYAKRRAGSLKDSGIDAFIAGYTDPDGNCWHRVIAGSYHEPENAARQAKALSTGGLDAFIVRHREKEGGLL